MENASLSLPRDVLDAMLEEAAERGAKRALEQVRPHDEGARPYGCVSVAPALMTAGVRRSHNRTLEAR